MAQYVRIKYNILQSLLISQNNCLKNGLGLGALTDDKYGHIYLIVLISKEI